MFSSNKVSGQQKYAIHFTIASQTKLMFNISFNSPAPFSRVGKPSRWTATVLDVQAPGNVAGGCSGGFSDRSKALQSTGYLQVQMINLRGARKIMPRQDDRSWKVRGSNPSVDKRFFSRNSRMMWNTYIYQVSRIIHLFSSEYMRQVYPNLIY